MAAITPPGNVGVGTVTGRFVVAQADTVDAGDAPDWLPMSGTVTFTPELNGPLRDVGSTPSPLTIFPKPIQSTLDANGYLTSPGNSSVQAVTLIATDDTDVSPVGWTYRVSFALVGVEYAPFSIAVPQGTNVDLTTVAPASSSTGVQIIQGPQGLPGGSYTPEDVQDTVAAMAVAGANMTITYNDLAGTLTFAAVGTYTDEQARDAIAAALTAGTGVVVSSNDALDTITVSLNTALTSLAGKTVPAGSTLADTTSTQTFTNKTLTAPAISSPTGITKSDVGLSAVPNTDATARANHIGTQLASTVSDFSTAADARIAAAAASGTGALLRQASPSISAPVIATIVNGLGTLTLPSTTDTLVGRATTDTLTNKTLTSPTISSPTVTGTPVGVAKNAATQSFTSSGTYAVPAGAIAVWVQCIGGGGGGGSGRRGPAAAVRGGGGAGGGGAISEFEIPASALGSSVTVTVGSAGSAGAAQTVDSTTGNNGGSGTASSFGSFVTAAGGSGGTGGTATTAAGGAGGATGRWPGGAGGGANIGGAAGSPGATATASAPGGGAGGGLSTANAFSAGGAGGYAPGVTTTGAAGGSTDGGGGTAGPSASTGSAQPGGGGGGGAASVAGVGGSGGAGGSYGAGGGGGGGSINGQNSGAGGAGGAGIVYVRAIF